MSFIELHVRSIAGEVANDTTRGARLFNVDSIVQVYGDPCKVHCGTILGSPTVCSVTETYEQVMDLLSDVCDVLFLDDNAHIQAHSGPT